jgi:beta-galactosidase
MYPNPKVLGQYASTPQARPLIMCEYAHAMGNSSGDVWSYWKQIYFLPHLQGALVWDWVDQAFSQPITDNPLRRFLKPKPGDKTYWAYGGDFGPADVPSDDNFCSNGLVSADRTPHPGLAEMKKIYQSIQLRLTDPAKGEVEIKNGYFFTNLKDLVRGNWAVRADDRAIEEGKLPELDLGPGEAMRIAVPLAEIRREPDVEYWLDFHFTLKKDQLWAKAGHEVAWEEFALPVAKPAPAKKPAPPEGPTAVKGRLPSSSRPLAGEGQGARAGGSETASNETSNPSNPPRLVVNHSADRVIVSGRDFSATVDKTAGALSSLRFHGTELVEEPLKPHFWRAPTDNDRGNHMPEKCKVWRTAARDWKVQNVSVDARNPRAVAITVTAQLPAVKASMAVSYTVLVSGQVLVDSSYTPGRPGKKKLPVMPRFGMQMALPPGFEAIEWYGRGPQETYWDRADARVNVYRGTVEEQYFDYTEPGETGNKVDVRWVALTNAEGIGLLAVGRPLLSVNALHYGTEDLMAGKHTYQLPHRPYITLNLDLHQMGVGGDNSWGAWPHPEFLLPADRAYRYQFVLRPFSTSEGSAMEVSRRVKGKE